jgi:hypothetical protein
MAPLVAHHPAIRVCDIRPWRHVAAVPAQLVCQVLPCILLPSTPNERLLKDAFGYRKVMVERPLRLKGIDPSGPPVGLVTRDTPKIPQVFQN